MTKYFSFFLVGIFFLTACTTTALETNTSTEVQFDAALATKVGADEYGMRSYVLVILKTGPAEITDAARRKELFAGHFSNMERLAKDGKLVLAGPFIEAGDKRGLYIFNVTTIADAKALVVSDPAVAAGIFEPEFTKYYGSAALMLINDLHKSIQEKSVG